MESSALLTLEVVIDTLNFVCRKFTILYRYLLRSFSKYLHRASNIRGVMLLGRPPLFEGAFVEPKQQRFLFIAQIERLLQLATAAILLALSDLLWIIWRISVCCESARFGAILWE